MPMQDNDFDKIFSHKFGQLPGEPYSEENWSELSRRIDIHERRQRRWLLPVLLPLFGLLAGGNLFWWYQWRETNDELKDSKSRTTFFQTDTIMRKTVVYHYDTIYQNVTLVQRQNAAMPAQFPPAHLSTHFLPIIFLRATLQLPTLIHFLRTLLLSNLLPLHTCRIL